MTLIFITIKKFVVEFKINKNLAYQDEFKIRYWALSTINSLLNQNGFKDSCKTFSQFNSTFLTFKLYHRQ
jgi:hypothetical protein